MAKKEKKEKEQKGQSILSMDVGELFKKKPKQAGQRAKKGTITEAKRTMNFVRQQSGPSANRVLSMAVVVLAVLLVFFKFGFMDPMAERSNAYIALTRKQGELEDIQDRLDDYEELKQQYDRYSYGRMNESEINLVNRMEVMDLVEKEIASIAFVENFAVNNNVLTLNIYGITLEQASTLVNRLESNGLVESASVNSASAADGVEARIFISIVLTKEVEEGELV